MKMNLEKHTSNVWSPGFSRQGFHFAERAGRFLARFELRALCRLKAGLHTCCCGLTSALLILLSSGCQTSAPRSISNSGYSAPDQYQSQSAPPWLEAQRELSELDVLGLELGQGISEEEIARASDHPQHVSLKPGSSVLLVQSGAMYPDGPMVDALNGHFNVVPFTGVATETKTELRPALNHWPYYRTGNVALLAEPGKPAAFVPLLRERESEATPSPKPQQPAKQSYSRLLRLAAARGGADTILCYWGILESENERLATKTVSWMPFMGWVVPDEREHLRIRVKMAVIDVRTGAWTMLTPEPFEDKALSASARRAAVDQKHVESLKARAYAAAAKDLIGKYAKS
ncbi:MAG TPA: hypothetical protein VN281_05670 [Verrucomicrobiae bacterium]|jgi:hypothetical protein|nr:hypothetical protein [Verrucomicrobiae bacterium]